jgi:hypothetical protein
VPPTNRIAIEDLGRRHQSARHGEQRAHRTDGRRLHGVVRARDDETSAGHGVIAPLELAGRKRSM